MGLNPQANSPLMRTSAPGPGPIPPTTGSINIETTKTRESRNFYWYLKSGFCLNWMKLEKLLQREGFVHVLLTWCNLLSFSHAYQWISEKAKQWMNIFQKTRTNEVDHLVKSSRDAYMKTHINLSLVYAHDAPCAKCLRSYPANCLAHLVQSACGAAFLGIKIQVHDSIERSSSRAHQAHSRVWNPLRAKHWRKVYVFTNFLSKIGNWKSQYWNHKFTSSTMTMHGWYMVQTMIHCTQFNDLPLNWKNGSRDTHYGNLKFIASTTHSARLKYGKKNGALLTFYQPIY